MGLRVHSGWAAAIAVGGSPAAPGVIQRRRIELADPALSGSVQPYHAAARLEAAAGERFLKRCRDATERLARQAMAASADELAANGYSLAACAVLLSSARPLPPLATVLASHALIHTAEGEHFRDALAAAAMDRGIPVIKIRERQLFERGVTDLGVPASAIQGHLVALGRALGPPWRQDEKLAMLAAWLALANAPRRR
jgi:hypothetical protein